MSKKKKLQSPPQSIGLIQSQMLKHPTWVLPFILILTFIAYMPALRAGFVNWDDGDYAYNNIFIRSLANIREILTTPVQGNYHPLTMFSLAINYAISGDNAWSYHLFNLIFHLTNCFLVFRLAMLLSKGNIIIAFTTSVLFGIHPMHVESVAWVSERKDVLYSLFFLAGLISYTKYVDTGSRKQYFLTILFAVLSLLSKPAAVIFPVVLFSIDILRQRKLELKLFIEKIPFLIPAFILGLATYNAQKAIGATTTELFPLSKRIFMGFYGIMAYFVKMIFPFKLGTFYPFPPTNEDLPIAYYLSPIFFGLLAGAFFYSLKHNRVIAFGIFFYLANLVLVLQFLTVGSAIIADRYTYMPFIGLFYIIGWAIYKYAGALQSKAMWGVMTITFLFTILSFKQSATWYDGTALWEQAIKAAPSYKAYLNRATVYKEENDYDNALEHFSQAIALNPQLGDAAYIYRGNIYFERKLYDLAFEDYKKALTIKQDDATVLHNMGVVFAYRNQYDSALKYYGLTLAKDSAYKVAYNSRGVLYMNHEQYSEAISDFQKYLRYEPNAAHIYNIIGTCYRFWLKQDESLKYVNRAIELDPDPHYYINRAHTYGALNNYALAKQDVLFAKGKGIKIDPALARELGIN